LSFAAPGWLLGLLLAPLALVAYRLARARATRYAVRFTAVPALREAAATVAPWRRHLPTALLLSALATLVLALARPTVARSVTVGRTSIMLVTDHSGSMQASDVAPTRLAAAQRAANAFIDALPGQASVGVVGYSTQPDVVQAPRPDHAIARQAIASQTAGGATATGDALQLAIDLLGQSSPRPPSAIVLLSDGSANLGRDPIAVATDAGHQGIPIYTVALGTQAASVPNPDPYGPPLLAAPPDPKSMRSIALASGARAFTAESAGQLVTIYQRLGSKLGSKHEHRQLTAVFAAGGLLLLVVAIGASQGGIARLP
jgi:Ca-activated chloride channel family protein